MKPPKRPHVIPKDLPQTDIKGILNIIENSGQQEWQQKRDIVFDAAYGCGLRISEALSLTLQMFSSDWLQITVKAANM